MYVCIRLPYHTLDPHHFGVITLIGSCYYVLLCKTLVGSRQQSPETTLERVAPSFGGWYSITLLILFFGGAVSTPAVWTLSLGGWIRTLTYPLTGGPSSKLPQNGRIPTYTGARDRCATPCEGGACAHAAVVIGWSRAPAGSHTNASPAPAKSNRVGQGRPRSHSHYSDYS